MNLSWNEIKSRALKFSKEFEKDASEDAEAKSFWDGFFDVFGISRRRVASFEEPVKKLGAKRGYVDLFWKGVMLVEHKSRGKDLDAAYIQALDYFAGIKEADLPKYVLVSDFARFRLHNLEDGAIHEFELKDLHQNVKLFGFIAGYQTHKIQDQDPVNIKAAERMGKLHDEMKAIGYDGHALEVYLVRLLFCLFAEDTGIFERQQFQEFIENRTSVDGSDLAERLGALFQQLNTPHEKRFKNLEEQLAAFPYINGKLFAEILPTASFDSAMREALLNCCALDWSRISPAIFGSLFQSIMDKKARRNLGAHYTSEKNILKLIKPLFLDDLWAEFDKVKHNKNKLREFHMKLRKLTFLDPACGCGNFLVIAYRELRLLELEVLRAERQNDQLALDVSSLIQVDVDQFYGIEIEEFPAQIAQVALWLMDHQMNLRVSEEFGSYFARIPLRSGGTVVCANALRINWSEVVPVEKLSFIMGNPPFIGAKFMNEDQKQDVGQVFSGIKNAGLLDFVAAWFVKAAKMIRNTGVRCAFVSTNSICQGEQVGVLWGWMLEQGVKISFAHRPFMWRNEAKGNAAVHCVIVGFSEAESSVKQLFHYEGARSEPMMSVVSSINPYLVEGSAVVLSKRSKPVCNVPQMVSGNKPIDDGNYLLTREEVEELLRVEPGAQKFIRRWFGSKEFINNIERYFLFLKDCTPKELQALPHCLSRVEKVRAFRAGSASTPTRNLSPFPTSFHTECLPKGRHLVIPQVSSERRQIIPIAFFGTGDLCGDKLRIVESATMYHFGVLNSLMHMSWVRAVTGRLKSDYQYSVHIVYNTFLGRKTPPISKSQRLKPPRNRCWMQERNSLIRLWLIFMTR